MLKCGKIIKVMSDYHKSEIESIHRLPVLDVIYNHYTQ